MRILIGYSMRSGSTLLQHLLHQHESIRSFSDLSSLAVLPSLMAGVPMRGVCVKPPDLFYLAKRCPLLTNRFEKFVWIARDPRDSYLSSIESGYAYLFWPKGPKIHGIDVGLLDRWRRIYRCLLENRERWHVVRYEDLSSNPEATIAKVFDYLELPNDQDVLNFGKFSMLSGGDHKLRKQNTVHSKSVARHIRQLSAEQQDLFWRKLGPEMKALGYEAVGPNSHGGSLKPKILMSEPLPLRELPAGSSAENTPVEQDSPPALA